jgi:hypothetical protein
MEIEIPHKFEPRDYQLPLLRALDNGCKRAVIVWNRRAGKDKVCFNYMVRRAFERVGTYYYFLPEYSQAKKVIWNNIDNDGFAMLDHIPKQVIKSKNNSDLKVELINGSVIQLIGADTFKESGVGANPIGVVFSEYSITSPEAWKFVGPILAVNGGWAIFNFTPRGKNHAWELLQKAKENEKWFTELLTINETHVLTDEALAEEKRNNPEAIIQQEYYCSFIDGAGQFFRRIHENTYDMQEQQTEHGDFQMGVDLAKYQDFTVITPFNMNTMRAYVQDRFNQIDWNLQKARIEAAALRYKARVKIDATGVGDPVVEDLKSRGLNITDEDAIKFTEATRMNLLNNLAMLLEQDKIQIPDDEGLITELESFQYSLSPLGKIKVGVPETMHDDRVFSLALAVHGITSPIPIDMYLHNPRFANREYEGELYRTTYD